MLRNHCYDLVMKTEERVSVSAFVDPDDHERLVERARLENRSVSAEIRQALKEHLRRAFKARESAADIEEKT